MRLTGWSGGTPVARVRAALTLKRMSFDDQTSEDAQDYARRVPTLVLTLQGRTLRIPQSLAILNFLEEAFPDPPLLPEDIADRARARSLLNMMVCDLQPWLDAMPERRPDIWARLLAGTEHLCDPHGYAVGNTLSIADTCIVPELQRAMAAGHALEQYPNLVRIHAVAGMHRAFH